MSYGGYPSALFDTKVSPMLPEALRHQPAFSNKVITQQAYPRVLNDRLPWIRPGDFVFDELEDNFYWIARSENLPAIVHAFSSVADATSTGIVRMDSSATDLETDRVTLLFQYFVGTRKDGFTYMQYPMGEQVFTTDKLLPATTNNNTRARAYLEPRISPFWDPTEFGQFFMRKGVSTGFEYFNNTGIAQIQKLRFVGKKLERAYLIESDQTRLSTGHKEFPLTLEVTPEDMMIAKSIARPLFLRRISGN